MGRILRRRSRIGKWSDCRRSGCALDAVEEEEDEEEDEDEDEDEEEDEEEDELENRTILDRTIFGEGIWN